jgi:hypothetical protein
MVSLEIFAAASVLAFLETDAFGKFRHNERKRNHLKNELGPTTVGHELHINTNSDCRARSTGLDSDPVSRLGKMRTWGRQPCPAGVRATRNLYLPLYQQLSETKFPHFLDFKTVLIGRLLRLMPGQLQTLWAPPASPNEIPPSFLIVRIDQTGRLAYSDRTDCRADLAPYRASWERLSCERLDARAERYLVFPVAFLD